MKNNLHFHQGLIATLTQSAKEHPSQVAKSIRHLLQIPTTQLANIHLQSRKNLQNWLERLPTDFPDLPESSNEIRNRRSFSFRPRTLTGLEISDCRDFILDLSHLELRFEPNSERQKFVIKLHACKNFRITGGYFFFCRNVMLIENCEKFSISDLRADDTEGYGMIIFNSRAFEIRNCQFHNSLASGIYCLGETSHGLIHGNTCDGSRGYFNWDAGLHINHCTKELESSQIPEHSHQNNSIVEKTAKPNFLHIENNTFSNNRAQGIYCEGALLCSFQGNTLLHNNKEGICFDWGSALNLFEDNVVTQNGERARLSQEEIKADFIEHFPQLPDGSSSCKLPGISIDNGCLNLIIGNQIHQNFGGGIKMVRSGVANLMVNNQIIDNAVGRNEFFTYFNGVNYLGIGSGITEFQPTEAKLDFLPSEHNICSNNKFNCSSPDSCIGHDQNSANNLDEGNINLAHGRN